MDPPLAVDAVEVDEEQFEKDRRSFNNAQIANKPKKQRSRKITSETENECEYAGPWKNKASSCNNDASCKAAFSGPTAEEREKAKEEALKNPFLRPIEDSSISESGDFSESCTFHVPTDQFKKLVDLDNLPDHNKIGSSPCNAPTKVRHVWTGHSKAVTSIRLIPKTAHLFLSCGLDHKIKLWKYGDCRSCVATYLGHNKPVREVNFNAAGTAFISCSFDRTVKLWDVETGKVLNRFKTDQLPFVSCFSPESPHEFFVGCNDGCIYQFDSRTPDPIKTFEGHLGPINTITFPWSTTAPSTFLSTSDDKTVRIWDVKSAQVEKYLSKSTYTAISSVAQHPTQQTIACQTARSQIITVDIGNGGFTFKPKKFYGHRLNGFGCPVAFSPDGAWLASGDGEGSVLVWSWEKALFASKTKIHDKAVMGLIWHPIDRSSLLSCSWDGSIKLLSV